METIVLPHLSQHPLHICLFADVQNAAFLHQQLIDGNQDFEYAFLDVTTLLSKTHVLSACFRAINDMINHRLKSRNVHSEIVFALSPNSNITESFRRFGISKDSKNILAIKVAGNRPEVEIHLSQNVQGKPQPFSNEAITMMHDVSRIKKIYRIAVPQKHAVEGDLDSDTENFVLGSMALKGS